MMLLELWNSKQQTGFESRRQFWILSLNSLISKFLQDDLGFCISAEHVVFGTTGKENTQTASRCCLQYSLFTLMLFSCLSLPAHFPIAASDFSVTQVGSAPAFPREKGEGRPPAQRHGPQDAPKSRGTRSLPHASESCRATVEAVAGPTLEGPGTRRRPGMVVGLRSCDQALLSGAGRSSSEHRHQRPCPPQHGAVKCVTAETGLP